jgi:hypothetical protein
MDWATRTANVGAGWSYHWYDATTATPPDWGPEISGLAFFNVPHLQDGYYRVAATSGAETRACVVYVTGSGASSTSAVVSAGASVIQSDVGVAVDATFTPHVDGYPPAYLWSDASGNPIPNGGLAPLTIPNLAAAAPTYYWATTSVRGGSPSSWVAYAYINQ